MTELAKLPVSKCPTNGCRRDAKLVRAAVQEFIHPVGGEKAAYYIVECAEHGKKLIKPVTYKNRDPHRWRRSR